MAKPVFYHATIKKLIVAFGTIFDDIRIIDGFNREITVPIHYSPKAKWMEAILMNGDLDAAIIDTVLPRMGFEMMGFNFAPERHLNPMNKFHDPDHEEETNRFMYNRVPYDFQFELNIATVKYEDMLKIAEQIIPFFTPELTITVRDMEEFNTETNIPIVLNSSSITAEYEGTEDTRRVITGQLQFTVKAFLYSNIRNVARIKRTILSMHNKDFSSVYERFISEVVPFEANKTDPHTIVDQFDVIDDRNAAEFGINADTGSSSGADFG